MSNCPESLKSLFSKLLGIFVFTSPRGGGGHNLWQCTVPPPEGLGHRVPFFRPLSESLNRGGVLPLEPLFGSLVFYASSLSEISVWKDFEFLTFFPCLKRLWIFYVFPLSEILVWKDFEYFTFFMFEIPVWKDLENLRFSCLKRLWKFTIVLSEKTLIFKVFFLS